MVGCLIGASGVAVQWRAHQSVDASVAGQPRVKLPVLDYAVHAVQSCQGRAPKCEDSQGRLSLGAAVEATAYWHCEWCSQKEQTLRSHVWLKPGMGLCYTALLLVCVCVGEGGSS